MLSIDCPCCGPRDEVEFRYGGQSHVRRPAMSEQVSDEAWAAYLFMRANPRGRSLERWVHAGGCGQWFNIVRDTATHQITATYPMGEAAPPSATGEQPA